MVGPLDGIRVVEVASFLAAPSSAALMADMGATVIKIEPPDGDTFRGNRAHLHVSATTNYVFEVDNRGKQSLALDLGKTAAQDALHRLIATADIFITNLTSKRTEKYRLDFETLKQIQPTLVYGHLVGYSSTGIDSERPGFDSTAYWARSGVMGLMGEVGAPAVQSRPGQGDHPTGVNLLAATLAALRLKEQTGLPQKAEVSLLRTGLWTIATDMQLAMNLPNSTPSQFNRQTHGLLIRSAYETKDKRWIMLTMHNVPKHWPLLCAALARPDWSIDSRFATNAGMLEHGTEIVAELQAEFKSKTLSEWAGLLDKNECIWAPAASLSEIATDPVIVEQEAIKTLEDVSGKEYRIISTPFDIQGADVAPRKRAPLVGEHNYEVLIEAGFSEAEITELAADGIFTLEH
jgi:crotonobetainyl-CoA:carnitine CoA-transferase CaiB-like acyl-CoA transferase